MIRNSLRAMTKELSEASTKLAAIAAIALFMLMPFSIVRADTTPVSPSHDDGLVQEQIYDALNADPTHFFRHVDVEVRNGVVTLSGYVWSVSSLYQAEKIAGQVPGVTRVVDRMELERNGVIPHA